MVERLERHERERARNRQQPAAQSGVLLGCVGRLHWFVLVHSLNSFIYCVCLVRASVLDQGIYVAVSLGFGLIVFGRAVVAALTSLRASRTLHDNMLRCVLRAPMSFFDTTPTGRTWVIMLLVFAFTPIPCSLWVAMDMKLARDFFFAGIINRFSKDLRQVDQTLFDVMTMFIQTVFSGIGRIVMIALVTPFFLVVLVPVAWLYRFIQQYVAVIVLRG